MTELIVFLAKSISFISKVFRLGAGATWSGEIALRLDPQILSKIAPKNIILVAGTNGKTTTTLMIKQILGDGVVTNASGANLTNGIVSAIITSPRADWGVFEVDENSLPIVLSALSFRSKSRNPEKKTWIPGQARDDRKVILVLLNLFRDQLDRYGEVDTIADNWKKALGNFSGQLIANADDPLIASLGNKKTMYFGLNDASQYMEKMEHATDSSFCPRCGTKLVYKGMYYSHIGDWHCPKCKNKRPDLDISTWEYPLPGLYNRYNTLAAVAVAQSLGIPSDLAGFHPAFGRQEEFMIGGKKVKIFLSKNPAGFNESLRTVIQLGAKQILFVLNDRIPDGRDVSWIWDVDFEMVPENVKVFASGDRVYDMALRLKYAGVRDVGVIREIGDIRESMQNDVYILATYSAMLDVRKILTGKKIL